MTQLTRPHAPRFIDAAGLCGLELAANGAHFELQGVDRAGDPWSLNLPSECLRNLILTLPNLALNALRRKHRDESLRIVYPAISIDVELASDHQTFIVTLRTADGFHVSFGLSEAQCISIGDSPHNAAQLVNGLPQPS
jgi:hypothetical protein